MSYHHDLSHHQVEEPTTIPRSPSACNLSSLAGDTARTSCKSRSQQSVSYASVDQSEFHGSENSQVLYMSDSPKKSRKLRGSLSSIDNRSTRIMDGPSDIKTEYEEDSGCEELSWNIIDREIFEWQYVCRTGRPYWWSPESKYIRLKKLQARLSCEPPRPWTPEVETYPMELYRHKRRAISDGFLAGQDYVEDLARLVAVQLLSSCFTLPPDHTGQLLPDYAWYDVTGPLNSPDPRLISSLRMHTHFRYSPCFGHQARNTSPAQRWLGAYDGLSPGTSPPQVATCFHTPVIGTSGSPPRRRKAHRALNVTEGSANSYLQDQAKEHLKGNSKHNLGRAAPSREWRQRQRIDDDSFQPVHPSQRSTRQRPKPRCTDSEIYMPETYRGVQSSSRSPTTNYRLQPVIRSEPHPVFVQPVKELVVKRWKTFRRRFGGSLNAPLPSGSEDNLSESSTLTHSDVSSPAMSSDGRTRRRRAQERGHIHSSVDSTPHYNSPASGYDTPDGNAFPRPLWVDSVNALPAFQLADPLAAAAALALAETQARPAQSTTLTSQNSTIASDSLASRVQCDFSLNSTGTSQSTEARIQPRSTPNPLTASYTNRIRKRQHRKSMLSEMHTIEDFAGNVATGATSTERVERSFLSTAGSALPSPKEETESDIDLVIRSGSRESIGNLGPIGAFSMRRMTVSSDTRPSPRLSRTSTTGTQVFTPSDEGVEIDGMPAGPSKELWVHPDGKGKRRERTNL